MKAQVAAIGCALIAKQTHTKKCFENVRKFHPSERVNEMCDFTIFRSAGVLAMRTALKTRGLTEEERQANTGMRTQQFEEFFETLPQDQFTREEETLRTTSLHQKKHK